MSRTPLANLVDAALEISVAGSFSRVGYAVRSRLEHWAAPGSMRGRVAIVTGASSGIGRQTALELARLGATVWMVGRDRHRTEEVSRQARALGGGTTAVPVVLDVTDAHAVSAFAAQVTAAHDRVDILVHAAGALFPKYQTTSEGEELTVATAVLAPFRLTWLLNPLLCRSLSANIVTVSSGGMYTQRFDLDRLEMSRDAYRGTTAYARAKRAQVVLSHEWARRWGAYGVASYASHPGWVDTPGLASGLPAFARLGPLLRTPAQGADTVVWLASGGARQDHGSAGSTEGFFHDRRLRSEHHLPWTADGHAVADGQALWTWCAARAGVVPSADPGGPSDSEPDRPTPEQ
jgi:dehydrogenase/reductase SDR family protein 12